MRRTDPDVVLGELPFKEGDPFKQEDLDEGLTRLRNTALFSKVEGRAEKTPQGYKVHLTTEDRWTTIPIMKFASGGGVNQLILGLFDPNILGQFVEAGGQYERLGETNSGVLWFKNPRLFGKRFSLFVQAWQNNRLRRKYQQDQIDPVLKTGFLHTRRKYYLELTQEIQWWLTVSGVIENHKDSFSDQYLDDETLEALALHGLPPDTTTSLYGLKLQFGRLDYDSFMVDGVSSELIYRHADHKDPEQKDFLQAEWSLIAAKTLWGQSTVAQRLMMGGTTTETVQYWYYLGGLDRVRGFSDNRFAGRYFWLTNTEVRYPVFRHEQAIVQANVFHDAVGTAEDFGGLNKATGASIGFGFRVMVPKIYRLVARLDFAKPIVKDDEIPISFGVQQFF